MKPLIKKKKKKRVRSQFINQRMIKTDEGNDDIHVFHLKLSI
jgi:hypothetical protein